MTWSSDSPDLVPVIVAGGDMCQSPKKRLQSITPIVFFAEVPFFESSS